MPTEQDLSTTAGVQAYLATTQFASSIVTSLTGGSGNFAYRLHLLTPYNGKTTLVLKHARPYVATAASIPFAIERQVRISPPKTYGNPGSHSTHFSLRMEYRWIRPVKNLVSFAFS